MELFEDNHNRLCHVLAYHRRKILNGTADDPLLQRTFVTLDHKVLMVLLGKRLIYDFYGDIIGVGGGGVLICGLDTTQSGIYLHSASFCETMYWYDCISRWQSLGGCIQSSIKLN